MATGVFGSEERRPALTVVVVIVLAVWLGVVGLAAAQGEGQDGLAGKAELEGLTSLQGWLNVVWPDKADGSGRTAPLYIVSSDDGALTVLDVDEDAAKSFGGMLRFNRQRVTVFGRLAASSPERLDGRALKLSHIEQDTGKEKIEGLSALSAVTGAQPWISILCRFNDVAVEPKALSYFVSMFDNTFPRLDHFWRQASYDNINLAGSGAVGWYTLPQPRSYYVTASGLNHDRAARDCTAVADAAVNFRNYVGINLMFNDELDGNAWGGSWYMTLDGLGKSWYMTWEPPWGYENIAVLAHEMGHGFGLPHSSGDYGQVYDNVWDVMSGVWSYCYLMMDPVYGCIAQGTIGYHKDRLGWIPAPQRYVHTGGQTTITLERLALPASAAYRVAIIPIGTSGTRYYTVEARRTAGYDARLPGDAVVIHFVDTSRPEPAHVIDVDLNGNTGDAGAMWQPGELFADAANSIWVRIDSATSSGYVVTVFAGQAPSATATPTPANTPFVSPTPTSTQPPVTATATGTRTNTPVPTPWVKRVNAGGQAYIDAYGVLWEADQPYTDGSWGYTYGMASATVSGISNTDDDPLYQAYRTWSSTSTPAYSFTVPNGRYDVTMRFIEPTYTAANMRRFDVRTQGVTVIAGLDIYAAAGGNNLAVERSFVVDVGAGVLNLGVIHLGVGNPLISAIQVQVVDPNGTATPTRTATQPPATATATSTSAPATATRTNTSVPATATATSTSAPATPTQTNTPALPTATPTPVTGSPAMRRVNAGGGAFTDVYGQLWEADRAYVSGGWGYTYGSTASTASAIDNTNDDALFQAYRSWTSSSTPAYSFTLPNGRYEVTMKFMEPTATGAGQRRFEIRSQGATVQAGFDIFAAAGGRLKAVDYRFQVDVTGGVLHIGMVHLGVGNPLVSAVEVRSLNGGTPAATSTPTRTNTSVAATATSTPTRTNTAAPPTATRTSTPEAGTPTPYLKRVALGGAQFVDTQGNVWEADQPYTTGSWGYTFGSSGSTTAAIANTLDDGLYQRYRAWPSSSTPAYSFTVPNGRYEVTLKLSEPLYTATNRRKFDVRSQGVTVMSDVDIYAAAGGKDRAVDRVFTVAVSTGVLNIGVVHLGVGDPLINGMQVRWIGP